jgi:antitoxin (DNA-binding transcriptional repressor) of toxin-antitoxin stability system
MSATISVEEAQAKLKELIHQMTPGEEHVITENQQPVAKLVSEQSPSRKPRQAGRWLLCPFRPITKTRSTG